MVEQSEPRLLKDSNLMNMKLEYDPSEQFKEKLEQGLSSRL